MLDLRSAVPERSGPIFTFQDGASCGMRVHGQNKSDHCRRGLLVVDSRHPGNHNGKPADESLKPIGRLTYSGYRVEPTGHVPVGRAFQGGEFTK
jgi:hypothetical protein